MPPFGLCATQNVANSVCEANGTTEARCFNAFWK